MSRGMNHCVFVDQQPKAIETIYENIKLLKLEEHTEVFRTEALRALKAASKRELQFDYIFLDPPYNKFSYEELLYKILKYKLLAEGGTVICEHDASEAIPDKVENLNLMKTEKYGSNIGVSIFKQEVLR